jgi:small subunit ribosomal protein S8
MSADTIANMLSQLKNASMVGKEYIEIPYSKVNEAVLKVFEQYEFIKKVKVFKEKGSSFKSLHVDIAYEANGDSKIRGIKRVSKSGRRLYLKSKEIETTNPKYGFSVFSTPKGIMSCVDARDKNLGGEIICKVI